MFESEKTIRMELELRDGETLEGDNDKYTPEIHSQYRQVAKLVGRSDATHIMLTVDGNEVYIPIREVKFATLVVEE